MFAKFWPIGERKRASIRIRWKRIAPAATNPASPKSAKRAEQPAGRVAAGQPRTVLMPDGVESLLLHRSGSGVPMTKDRQKATGKRASRESVRKRWLKWIEGVLNDVTKWSDDEGWS